MEELKPEVIFLEALENTYSNYDKTMFSSFGVYHKKLEIEAIQKYSNYSSIDYVPVLESGLSDLFNQKYERVCKNNQHQVMLNELNSLAKMKGFPFLNSQSSMVCHQRLRHFENRLQIDKELEEAVKKDIDAYENSMLKNIYAYCRINRFDNAVFMCGSAHRQSLIEKIRYFKSKPKMNIKWVVYGD